jgi:hypothetical protein
MADFPMIMKIASINVASTIFMCILDWASRRALSMYILDSKWVGFPLASRIPLLIEQEAAGVMFEYVKVGP